MKFGLLREMSRVKTAAIGFWLVLIGFTVVPELVSPGSSESWPIYFLSVVASTMTFVIWIELDARENDRLFSTRRRLFNILIPPVAALYYAFTKSGLIGVLRLLGWVALGVLAFSITCLVVMWINPAAFPEDPEEIFHQGSLGGWESEHWDTALDELNKIE